MMTKRIEFLLLSAAAAGAAWGAAATPRDDSSFSLWRETIPELRRSLDGLSMSFVRIARFGASEHHPDERSFAYTRCYQFDARGRYLLKSRSIDPLVTPQVQIETGTEIRRGQRSTVYFNGEIELCHEDIPATDDDLVVVSQEPTHLWEEDPRLFGLCSMLFDRIDTIEREPDGRYRFVAPDGLEALVELDEASMSCRRMTIFRCGGAAVGEYRFSDFREWRVAGRSTLRYPARTDIKKFGPSADQVVYHATFLLREVSAAPELDVEEAMLAHEIPPRSMVMDGRFVPVAHYQAGQPGADAVTIASMGAALLDRLERGDDPHSHHERPRAQAAATPPPLRTAVLVGLLLFGFVTLHRIARAAGRGARPGAAALLAAFACAQHAVATESPIRFDVDAFRWSGVEAHQILWAEASITNETHTPVAVELSADDDFVLVWPPSVSVAAGESASISVTVVAPAVPATRSVLRADWSGGSAGPLLPIEIELAGDGRATSHGAVTSPPATTASPRPSLSAETWTRDLGSLLDSDTREIDFEFRNDGTSPVEVRQIVRECGCTEAEVSPRRIEPGQAGRLHVVFDPENRGGLIERSVTLVTDDPFHPLSKFTVRADIRPEIELEPGFLALEDVAAGEELERFLTLRFARTPRALTAVEAEGVTIIDHAMLVEDDGVGTLALVLAAPDRHGPTEGEIQLSFAGRRFPVRLGFKMVVRAPVFTQPSTVGFTYIDRARPAEASREVAVFSGEEDVRIVGVDADANLITVAEVDARPPELARFRVTPATSCPIGFFSTRILVATDRHGVIEVPVRGFVASTDE